MEPVGASLYLFIRPCGVEHSHEHVAVYEGMKGLYAKHRSDLESRIGLHAVGIYGNDRNVRYTGFFQGSPYESDIVAGPAAASGLGHDNGRVLKVVLSGKQRVHYLSDDYKGRVAGVVIYIFKPHVYGVPVVICKDHKVIARVPEYRLQKLKVYRRHLRAKYGIVLFHLLGEVFAVIGRGNGVALDLLHFPDLYGRNERTYTYPCGA